MNLPIAAFALPAWHWSRQFPQQYSDEKGSKADLKEFMVFISRWLKCKDIKVKGLISSLQMKFKLIYMFNPLKWSAFHFFSHHQHTVISNTQENQGTDHKTEIEWITQFEKGNVCKLARWIHMLMGLRAEKSQKVTHVLVSLHP